MMRLLSLLLLSGACASNRVTVQTVTDVSTRELNTLRIRTPTRDDLDPARAANAPGVMLATSKHAELYLEQNAGRGDSLELHVRTLLACSRLAQGDSAAAAVLTRDIRAVRDPAALTPRKSAAIAAMHATGVCVAVDAREAANAMFRGEVPVELFVRQYGPIAGLLLPSRRNPGHEKYIKLEASKLKSHCFPGKLPAKRVKFHRSELLRMISEQMFNEISSLLVSLPVLARAETPTALEQWLAKVAVASTVDYRHIMVDLLPVPLNDKQKEWQREQANSVFQRAKGAAAYFLGDDARERIDSRGKARTPEEELYSRLLRAEEAVLAWITMR